MATKTPAPRSIRFWHSGRNNLGAILAILAGVTTLAAIVRPSIVPQGHGNLGAFWAIASAIIAVGYLVGFFLADRKWQLARLILFVGAAVQILVGLITGWANYEGINVGAAIVAALIDIVPAILAIVAAMLIGPPPAGDEGPVARPDWSPTEAEMSARR